jgi:hypothetical protein
LITQKETTLTALATGGTTLADQRLLVGDEVLDAQATGRRALGAEGRTGRSTLDGPDGLAGGLLVGVAVEGDGVRGRGEGRGCAASRATTALSVLVATTASARRLEEGGTLVVACAHCERKREVEVGRGEKEE